MSKHNAPLVVYPLGRSKFHGALLLGVWFAGLVLVICWWLTLSRADWRIAFVSLTIIVSGAAAFSSWKNVSSGQLVWDGQNWRWQTPGYQTAFALQQVSVVADFQSLLLLRADDAAQARWFWVDKQAMPERWLDFRRAVYSPRKTGSAEADRRSFVAASAEH